MLSAFAFFMLINTSPAFAFVMMHECISISTCFPNHSPQQMSRFLQTPELWGSGPLLLLGVPRFHVHNGQHVFRCGDDKGVAFNIFDKEAMLISDKSGRRVDLHVEDIVHVRARVKSFRPNNQGCYLSLVLFDKTQNKKIMETPPEHIQSALQNFLWQGMEKEYVSLSALNDFRKNAKT